MPTYKAQANQTLYDIALQLYGTIEGLFDLLISNPDINMIMDLTPGQELEYHEEFVINQSIVDKFKEGGTSIVNGERHIYHKPIADDLIAVIKVPAELETVEFSISGEGEMKIDWGDNTAIEHIPLSHAQVSLSHYFDDTVDERRVRIYGKFSAQCLDITRLKGDMFLTGPLTVDEFICQANDNILHGLFLFEGVYSVNLQNMILSDLSPLYDMSLMTLDLRGVKFQDISVLDDYLQYIRKNYGNRRACKVYLDSEPSENGMKAIMDIITEPEWNSPDKWEFHINSKIYTTIEDGENAN